MTKHEMELALIEMKKRPAFKASETEWTIGELSAQLVGNAPVMIYNAGAAVVSATTNWFDTVATSFEYNMAVREKEIAERALTLELNSLIVTKIAAPTQRRSK